MTQPALLDADFGYPRCEAHGRTLIAMPFTDGSWPLWHIDLNDESVIRASDGSVMLFGAMAVEPCG